MEQNCNGINLSSKILRPSVEKLLDAMNQSISFIVARNPFERLVSAYRDKIVNAIKKSYHSILGKVRIHFD